jgi:hypothetical protein
LTQDENNLNILNNITLFFTNDFNSTDLIDFINIAKNLGAKIDQNYNKNLNYIIVPDENFKFINSFNIPVVESNWLKFCLKRKKLLNVDTFLLS